MSAEFRLAPVQRVYAERRVERVHWVPLAAMPPPNILLLTTDQQRADTVAAWQRATGRAGTAHSPNADRLAREGVIFTDAYTASPVCAPARASLLLGVHVPLHGVFDNSITQYLTNSSTPYPSLLKRAGYVTALIGKARFRPAPPKAQTPASTLNLTPASRLTSGPCLAPLTTSTSTLTIATGAARPTCVRPSSSRPSLSTARPGGLILCGTHVSRGLCT